MIVEADIIFWRARHFFLVEFLFSCFLRELAMASKPAGRRPTYAYRYFTAVPNTNDSKCTIPREDGSLCNVVVKGGQRYGGNLNKHLASYHEEIRKLVRKLRK